MSRINIGLLFMTSGNYYAREDGIREKTLQNLHEILSNERADIITPEDYIETEKDLSDAIRLMKDAKTDMIIMHCSSFFDGSIMSELSELPDVPFFLWGIEDEDKDHPVRLHSLLALLMGASIFRNSAGATVKLTDWFYGRTGEDEFRQPFLAYVRAIRARKTLNETRIGWVGGTAAGFTNMDIGIDQAKKTYGFSTEFFTEKEIVDRAEAIPSDEIHALIEEKKSFFGKIEVPFEHLERNVRLAVALKDIAAEKNLTSLAVSCWPAFQEMYHIVPCLALTMVNDIWGIPVSCEGDILGVVSMILAKELSGKTSMVFDIADVKRDQNALLVWHCGIMTCSLMDRNKDVRIIKHPMLCRKMTSDHHMGCSFDCFFKEQDVSAIRLLNSEEHLFALTGTVKDLPEKGFTGTRGWMTELRNTEGPVTVDGMIGTLIEHGVEHHLAVTPGNLTRELAAYSKITGIGTI